METNIAVIVDNTSYYIVPQPLRHVIIHVLYSQLTLLSYTTSTVDHHNPWDRAVAQISEMFVHVE